MKFTTATLLLALAALTVANPVASPVADPVAAPKEPPPVDKPNCRDCDNNYTKGRASWACWFNPQACDVSCRADTCRHYDGFCKANCGYNNC
ncbi:uncharacterized protein ALTATR162_LOCUS2887 [Alternaria atra]|uniref:Uncharacterized protein n=1 Tax=Alternaria atra TaxID=119953 RepID=A0A8J2HZA7_9PLEO|nr:uncharacterized protein ALTATR162_LOCUS2887 [Alternaria atra]CAG5152723.1 unnamed protein product [Alternaria atra]